jgi:dihydroorotase
MRSWISLVEDTGGRVHFGRLSSARGVSLLESALARGLPVSADVAAHHLFMSEADLDGFNVMAHVIPPLRSADDRDALRAAVRSGVVAAVCSDHQPHEADAKTNPFPQTEAGISALETLLPLCLRLVHEGALSPLQAAARLSSGPLAVLGLAQPSLEPGAVTDLLLLDPQAEWQLQPELLASRGRNTPFAGLRFQGRALRTWPRHR